MHGLRRSDWRLRLIGRVSCAARLFIPTYGMKGSQNALRARVSELIVETVGVSSTEMTAIVQNVDELLEIDPPDKRLF